MTSIYRLLIKNNYSLRYLHVVHCPRVSAFQNMLDSTFETFFLLLKVLSEVHLFSLTPFIIQAINSTRIYIPINPNNFR